MFPRLYWSGTITAVASVVNHPGIVKLTSTSTGQIVQSYPVLGMPSSTTPIPFETVCIVKTPSVFPTDMIITIGYTASSSFSGFRFDKNQGDTQWMSLTGNPTGINTVFAPISESTWYKLKIRFDGSSYFFSIDGSTEQQHTTNLPTSLNGFALTTKSATSFDLLIDYYSIAFLSLTR